jgi:hypothetical protein
LKLLKRVADYAALARRVSTEHGIPVIQQAFDILHLARKSGRIGPGDYFTYRLFDKLVGQSEKEEFVGWKAEPRLDSLNDRRWHCLGLDKVLTYSLLRANNIRIPDTRAIYLPNRARPLGDAVSLDSPAALHSWLRVSGNYPFFSKPSASGFARGAFFAESYDDQSDRVVLRNGPSIGTESLCREFLDIEKLGYLFQTPVQTDPRLAPTLGATVTSLRMMVLCDEVQEPILHRAFWKLPVGSNIHDNYNGGLSGNLAAAIDPLTGQIARVINGTGLDIVEVAIHPDTGADLKTLFVPDWMDVLNFTLKAALTLPKLRFQQWDIALSDDGPVVLEVNLFGTGGRELTQMLYRRGLLDATMKAFLARHEFLSPQIADATQV